MAQRNAHKGANGSAPLVVVSSDGHVGPLLRDQLRDYCPPENLSEFDEFLGWHESLPTPTMPSRSGEPPIRLGVEGHFEPTARLADMDRDGVAAEVLFHNSLNGQPLPFLHSGNGGLSNEIYNASSGGAELMAIGLRIYNRWLADFVAAAPDRFIGMAYLPMWDIDAAIAEARWAASVGLRGVNFPAPGRPGVRPYNDPVWEPFWATCAELGLVLTTHAGGIGEDPYRAFPGGLDIALFEGGGYFSRRAAWWLALSGVFDRHTDLRLVLTEQWEGWWTSTLRDLDELYAGIGGLRLPRKPSDYMRSNVYLGASFPSVRGVEEAVREGFADRVLWGRDYPHPEGTWQYAEDPDTEPSTTRLALQHVFSAVPPAAAAAMVGENAVHVYGLDRVALDTVAARIAAPTAEDLAHRLESIPEVHPHCRAFRGINNAGERAPVASAAL